MTAGPERQFDLEAHEDAQRERLQDLGVSNNFEATVRISTGEITIPTALGYQAGRLLKHRVDDLHHPERVPHIGPELREPLTEEDIEAKRIRNEAQRMYFIDSQMRERGITYLLALARSVKQFGPLPPREQSTGVA